MNEKTEKNMKKHPLMPLIEEADKYLSEHVLILSFMIGGFYIYRNHKEGKTFVRFRIQARYDKLDFLSRLGVDINYASMKEIKSKTSNNLDFEATAEISDFRELMQYADHGYHVFVSLIDF